MTAGSASRQSFSYIQGPLRDSPQLNSNCPNTDNPAFHSSPPHKTALQSAQSTAYGICNQAIQIPVVCG